MRDGVIANEKSNSKSKAIDPILLAKSQFIALVGSPNSGKTTLFNWLTGSRFKTVNYPGSTVDYSIGLTHQRYDKGVFQVMDTPGTYSLDPKSPDELVTVEAIYNHKNLGSARLIISVVDASQLSRHLYVTKQLIDAGFRVVLAITMSDLLVERREQINLEILSQELGVPVVLIDGRLGGGVIDLVTAVRKELEKGKFTPAPHRISDWNSTKMESVMRETDYLSRRVIESRKDSQKPNEIDKQIKINSRDRTRQLDRILLHPVFGLLIFFALMVGLFSSINWFAQPLMDGVDKALSFVADLVLKTAPENLFLQFLSGGVIASVSAVVVFTPQIFILFLGIILLEDSGYLARAATLIDRPLAKLGMGGRSFVPLLSGFACAVPAMMAARTINSKKERWMTLFVLPLMSCSARLPVYALLLAFLFRSEAAWKGGILLAGIYFGSLVLGSAAAMIAGRFIKIKDQSFFMLELPIYRRPKVSHVLHQAMTRTKGYLLRAGPAIFIFAMVIWIGTTFPRYDLEDKTERLNHSYAAQMGRAIEPVFTPMGGDWRTGVGLISAFAAREVFVSSLAVLFQVTDGDESAIQESMLAKMAAAKAPNGLPLFTLASVLGLVVFFMIALQCLSTVTVAFRESGAWRFAIGQLVVFNLVAYVLAIAIVQGLRALGIS